MGSLCSPAFLFKENVMQHTFRANKEDEQILNALCFHLERNLADTVRFAIRRVARDEGLISNAYRKVDIDIDSGTTEINEKSK